MRRGLARSPLSIEAVQYRLVIGSGSPIERGPNLTDACVLRVGHGRRPRLQ